MLTISLRNPFSLLTDCLPFPYSSLTDSLRLPCRIISESCELYVRFMWGCCAFVARFLSESCAISLRCLCDSNWDFCKIAFCDVCAVSFVDAVLPCEIPTSFLRAQILVRSCRNRARFWPDLPTEYSLQIPWGFLTESLQNHYRSLKDSLRIP